MIDSPLFQQLAVPALLAVFSGLAVLVIAQGLPLFRSFVSRVQNDQLRSILELVGVFAITAVGEVMQEAVAILKASAADGDLTREEALAARDLAARRIWERLPSQARSLLVAIFGSREAVLERAIVPAVEAAVIEKRELGLSVALDEVSEADISRAYAVLGIV